MIKKRFFIRWRLVLLCLLALTVIACSEAGNEATPTPVPLDNASGPVDVLVGNAVSLQGIETAASDSGNTDNVIYLKIVWTIISSPDNSQATILNPNSATPTFRPDIVGEYILRVVITQNGSVLADNEIKIVAGLSDVFPPLPDNHLTTTDICVACHDPNTWALTGVNHDQVVGTCSSCHDNITILGIPPIHIETASECDICHTTNNWFEIPGASTSSNDANTNVDHTGFAGNCIGCHDGINASGKPLTHIETSSECDTCHLVIAWVSVAVVIDHIQVTGSCESCHDGVIALGKPPVPAHIETTQDCVACHGTATWLPVVTP